MATTPKAKKDNAACKICLISEDILPKIPKDYSYLVSLFPIIIKTCIVIDKKNNKIHLLTSNDAARIVHHITQCSTDNTHRWILQTDNKYFKKTTDRRNNFKIAEYCSEIIDQWLRLPIANILDSLKE